MRTELARHLGLQPCRIILLLFGRGLTLSCREPIDPITYSGAQALLPQTPYALWWNLAESCSGLRGPLERVRWFVVPRPTLGQPSSASAVGHWSPTYNSITLAQPYVLEGRTVRHEMLHALIGRPGHPREYFRTRCGGLVDCDIPNCPDDSPEPVVPPSSDTVPPEALRLTVTVVPGSLSGGVANDWLSIVVAATNPSTRPVWVRLTPESEGSLSHIGFGVDALGRRQFVPTHEAAIGFLPGETIRQSFDFRAFGDEGYAGPSPFTYTVRGFFNTDSSATTQLTVGQ